MVESSSKINKIEITRQMNASTRRIPFQKKIGSGLTLHDFHEKMDSGAISGHVGLDTSIDMIASALKWKLDRIDVEKSEPVISEKGVSSDAITVSPGNVCGLTQKVKGIKISLIF